MAASLDQGRLQQRAGVIGGVLRGATISLGVSIGVRLGLYEAMAGAGPLTSTELAERANLHERWVREWLYGQASAGIVDYTGEGRFRLSDESAVLLADGTSLVSMMGMFRQFPGRFGLTPMVEEAFRTGVGFHVDDRGEAGADALKALLEGPMANWHRQVLVGRALPQFEGVVARLENGGAVADVGCGSGVAVLELAGAFPSSTFHGYDTSKLMLAEARENAAAAGRDNVAFFNPDEHPLPATPAYDLIMTIDCLHDMTDPVPVARAIRSALRPDGTWLIGEIAGRDTFEENLRENPGAATAYSLSLFACLASSMAEPGGVGYGTLGLPAAALRHLAETAGFSRFRSVAVPEAPPGVGPALFEARP